LILSIPHAGRELTPGLAERLTEAGRSLIDTDWWLERLYGFAADEFDATVLKANLSRYVIDLNRDPAGASLYPGQATTELVPTTTFDGAAIYRTGSEPQATEIVERRRLCFDPYHFALSAELVRVTSANGYALLYDCHSIRSTIPRLFSGTLPVFNLGTNSCTSCASSLEGAIADVLASSEGFTHIVNGRFKGGWITRQYGRPADSIHAVQMELACRCYMHETAPFTYDEAKAGAVQSVVREVLDTMLTWGEAHRETIV
jgi:N-formylglutamate amidohydrolase